MYKCTHIVKTHPSEAVCADPVINEDGMVWKAVMPKDVNDRDYEYHASIPDERIDHSDFESFGWHHVYADTIGELIKVIRSFGVPYYSENKFLNNLKKKDKTDTKRNCQTMLYCDQRGAKVTRGEYNIDNMTWYTSF